MYYVYVLKTNKSKPYFYIGFFSDLKDRIKRHNSGLNISTKRGIPQKLIYYEAYVEESKARGRERKLKQRGKLWKALKDRINIDF